MRQQSWSPTVINTVCIWIWPLDVKYHTISFYILVNILRLVQTNGILIGKHHLSLQIGSGLHLLANSVKIHNSHQKAVQRNSAQLFTNWFTSFEFYNNNNDTEMSSSSSQCEKQSPTSEDQRYWSINVKGSLQRTVYSLNMLFHNQGPQPKTQMLLMNAITMQLLN